MRCRVCGYEIPEQARFCRQCGTKVEDMFGQTEDVVEEHTSDPDQDLQSGPPLKNEEKQFSGSFQRKDRTLQKAG